MPAEQFRRDRMMALADFNVGVGLEIGPLDRPIALKSECDVRYVDVFDAPSIRTHYGDDPGVDTDAVPDLDFCLHTPDGEIQSLVEAVKSAGLYSWVVASHVIEHVPDLIGWLGQVAAVLRDGGRLVLAIPDRRYTFDALRPQTTVGQILQAQDDQDVTPSIRAVYDHFRSLVSASAPELWAGNHATESDRVYDLSGVLEQVRLARDEGRYVDSHVWMFTPLDFGVQMHELGLMKLVDFYVQTIVPTQRDEFEFYAALCRIPRNASDAEADALRQASGSHFLDLSTDAAVEADSVPPSDAQQHQTPEQHEGTEQPDPMREQPTGDPTFLLSSREVRLIQAKRRVINFFRRQ